MGAAVLLALEEVQEESVEEWQELNVEQAKKVTLERLTRYLHTTTSRTEGEHAPCVQAEREPQGSPETGEGQQARAERIRELSPPVTANGTEGGGSGGQNVLRCWPTV